MMTSINILPSGCYEVAVWLSDGRDYFQWHILRQFVYQGDAIEFCNWDVPRFSEVELQQFIKTYNKDIVHKRLGFKRYKRISE